MTQLYVTPDVWRTYQTDSTDFLYRVRRAVNGQSRAQKVGARGQAVSIFYSDGLTVDVAAMDKDAIRLWRIILGDSFPAYG